MKVLGVTPLYPPSSRVGAWLSTHECLQRLAERGHEVHVRTVFAPADYTHGDVRVLGRWDRSVAGYDAVVSHHGDTTSGVRQLCIKRDIPHVLMVHGTPDQVDDSEGPVVWNSESSRAGRNGIVVRPHVDPAIYRTTAGDHVTLINLSREKGGDLFRQIVAAMPERKFLGVRGGYGRQRIPADPNVEMVPTTTDMAADVYSRTRVLLMPSKVETWGRTGVEALCSGIPVIAHPTPGLVESLGAAGIFVDRNDLAGWVGAIRRLDDPDEYARRSAAALARVAELDTAADLDRFADYVEACA